MKREILLGDEAVGLGAIDAGLSGIYGYPGTPSTEIFEFVDRRTKKAGDVHAFWSTNEKVAYEEALGMSWAGKRALVCMKHVGLNVAADAFMNSAVTGTNGGLVLAVADDPRDALIAERTGQPLLRPVRPHPLLRAPQPAGGLRHDVRGLRSL